MKVLINKLKKTNKLFLSIFILTFVLFLVSYVLLVKNLISLSGIETVIRAIVIVLFGFWCFVYLLWGLVNLILKKHTALVITSAITIILAVIFSVANYYINVIYKGIGNLAESEYVTYTSNLVVLNDAKINQNSTLGMINSTDDIEGNVLAKKLIDKENLGDNEVISFASYYEMVYALLNKEVDGIFLNSNYKTIFDDDSFEGIDDTIILYTYSEKMKNQDTQIISNKSLTEPFTILLMGVDSMADGIDASSAFNGDTLMLITFNPKTLNATMFSIPRDTYVPIACNSNRYAKINSAAAYGTNCVISTVEQLTSIDIDYYVKINFKGVVDLVEALGGVDVDVEAPDYDAYSNRYNGRICEQNSKRQKGEHLICFDSGMQHLNGEEALAYARCRHGYLQSDIARNKHQQQLIESIAKKLASPSTISNIEELLNAVTNNLSTNMSRNQILSFYEVMKNMISKSFKDGDFISIQKTYLEYYNLGVRLSNNGIKTSAIGHYPGSLEAIVNLMKVNLELEPKEMIKTFSFDVNENYKTRVTGQGITIGEKLEVVPNFVGKSVGSAEEWAEAHDIIIHKQFVSSGNYYNPNISPGLIANQSVSEAILVNNVSEITVYINDSTSSEPGGNEVEPPTPDPDNNQDDSDNNNDNSDDDNTSDNTQDNQNNDDDTSNDNPLDMILPIDDTGSEE
ncbi:MAG: LCP family protein, partial [Bacilli bacterium]|nr:LCP family protein [Bacilli bacterium]